MIDEYQDTNRLQDDLLRLLHKSGQNHRFMVGDMKQSIYRFRQADPTLFKDYYDQFSADGQSSEALDLSDNYRSRHEVTDLVNLIFEQLMDQQLGEMVYDDKASLKPKADWGPTGTRLARRPRNSCSLMGASRKRPLTPPARTPSWSVSRKTRSLAKSG